MTTSVHVKGPAPHTAGPTTQREAISMSTTTLHTDIDPEVVERLASRARLTAGLRDLADFLDEHTELPDPHVWASSWEHLGGTPEAFRAACEALFPLGGATVKPHDDRDDVVVKRSFGPVAYELQAKRSEVCEARSTTREVVEHVLPEWAQPPAEDAVKSARHGAAKRKPAAEDVS